MIFVKESPDGPPYMFLSEREAAGFLRIAAGTLRQWRHLDEGPAYRYVGRRVIYKLTDLVRYADSHAVSTTEQDATPRKRDKPEVRPGEVLLHHQEVAGRWSVSSQALSNMRSAGKGPAFIKIGSRVRYRMSDIEAYEENQRRTGDV